jgi:hypothetical protein
MAISSTFVTGQVFTAADANLMANSGLTYISTTSFSGSPTAQFQSCFTSSYTNYCAVIRATAGTTAACYLRYLVGSTVQTDNLYSVSWGVRYSAGTVGASTRGDQYALFGAVSGTYQSDWNVNFYSPQVATYTNFQGDQMHQFGAADYDTSIVSARNAVTTQINGFELTTAGATNIAGTMTLYGYRKA